MLTRRRFLTGAVAAGVTAAVAADSLLELAGDRKFFLPPKGGWAGDFETANMRYKTREHFILGHSEFIKPEGGRIPYDGDGCALNSCAHPVSDDGVTLMKAIDQQGLRMQWVSRDKVEQALASGYTAITENDVEWWHAPPMAPELLALDERALETIEIEIPGFFGKGLVDLWKLRRG